MTIPLPIPTLDWHNAGHPAAFQFGQPETCPFCSVPAQAAEKVRAAVYLRDQAINGRDDLPLSHVILAQLQAAEAELVSLKDALERVRVAAKTAQSIAAAPDYDEEAIRVALWHVVDVAAAREALGR